MSALWNKVDSFAGNSTSARTTHERPCPICGSTRFKSVLQLDQFQFYSDSAEVPKRADLRQVQCLDCFALCLNPCYSDYGFQVLFAEAGRSYGSAESHSREQIDWLRAKGVLRAGTRFLDAGCYDGRFLAMLPNDLQRSGVDVDKPAIERGRQRFGELGIEFIHGDFESFHCDRALDTITMFHVLEHLPRPKAALSNLRSMAHDGTRLVVEVPVLEKGITNDINGFFSVQHMTHFTRASLRECLALAGWKIDDSKDIEEYNGLRVVAVPAEPTKVPERDLQATGWLHRYLAAWHSALQHVEERLSRIENAGRCVLWGGGVHTEFLYHTTSFFQSRPDRDYFIVDSDPVKKGKSWRGIKVYSPDVLPSVSWSEVNLVVSSYGSQAGIVKAAIELGVPADRIVTLYDELRVY